MLINDMGFPQVHIYVDDTSLHISADYPISAAENWAEKWLVTVNPSK